LNRIIAVRNVFLHELSEGKFKKTRMKKRSIITFLLVVMGLWVSAQEGYTDRARNYIQQYAEYAIADQKATGVPASVTLGQGILETEAGISELMVKANNHFGVKCKNNWQGETFLHTDDAKNECFKKYKDALESYNDHSAHLLRNPRYSVLFTYSPTDYARWAHGLKKCGYATNPKYAYQLIKIIEEYHLQEYTYAALDSNYELPNRGYAAKTPLPPTVASQAAAAPAVAATAAEATQIATVPATPAADTAGYDAIAAAADSASSAIQNNVPLAARYPGEEPIGDDGGKILTVNGLKAVRGKKEDVLLQYAVQYKIRYGHLLEMNDLADEPLPFDTYVYLEKKRTSGLNATHTVKEGETLLMVAQAEGIQLKKLAALNLLNQYEQPKAGVVLQLQETATVKPLVTEYTPPKATALDTLQQVASAEIASSTQTASFGMSFAAPADDEPATGAAKTTKQEAVTPPQETVTKQDTAAKKTINGIARQPFMKDDPPQPQLRKPATEKEYKPGDRNHIVRRGETAYSIAKKHGVTVAQLLKWNDIEAQDLKAGQTIKVSE
jgi:LysM repeat protein